MSSKSKRCNTLWYAAAIAAAGLVLYWILTDKSKSPSTGSFLTTHAVANEHQLVSHASCAQLQKQNPAAVGLCHQLFPAGRYPLPQGIQEQPRLVPKNFADQYSANERSVHYPSTWNQKSDNWTMNLQDCDNKGFDSSASYKSTASYPSFNELLYRPGALQNERTYLNDNLRIRPFV